MQPVVNDAAWRGTELFERPEWKVVLTTSECHELLATAGPFAMFSHGDLDDVPGLPLLRPKLEQIQHWLEQGTGAVRIQGFPADVPLEVARAAFWILCRHLGTPVSQSATGERIFSVRDAGFVESDARSRGPNTRKRLSFHTDRCDVIGFLCFRQARLGGENQVVSSVSLYNEILARRPELAEILMESYLYQRHNVDTGNDRPYCEQPIFSFCEGHFAANLLRVLIDRAYAMPDTPEMTELQRTALDLVEATASDEAFHASFRQVPGDMLFLNNFVTFHRRSEFVDWDEPEQKRHLLRIWLAVPNSRPLDPRFAANYGTTAAGAIRGGMMPQANHPGATR